MCVCVCVCERERERESMCVCVCEKERERVWVGVVRESEGMDREKGEKAQEHYQQVELSPILVEGEKSVICRLSREAIRVPKSWSDCWYSFSSMRGTKTANTLIVM